MVTNPRGAVYIKADQPVKRIPRDFSSGAPCKAEKEEYNVKYARALPGAFLSLCPGRFFRDKTGILRRSGISGLRKGA